MKNLLIVTVLMISAFSMHAQVKVSEGSKSMVEGTYNAYSVTLVNVEQDEAEDMWKDFMKEFKAKVKKDKKAKIHFSNNVQCLQSALIQLIYMLISLQEKIFQLQ